MKEFKIDLEKPEVQNMPGISEIIITDDFITTKRISKKFGLRDEFKFKRNYLLSIWYDNTAIHFDGEDENGKFISEMITYYEELDEHLVIVKEIYKILGGTINSAYPKALESFINNLCE